MQMGSKRKLEYQSSYQTKQILKKITRDRGRLHNEDYIMIKGSIQEEDTTIVNTYVSNKGAPQYIRQTQT